MQRDPSLIQFNDLSTLSQKKFERARSKYLVDKLTGKLNNADYFLQLTRSMAEFTGQDTDEFLSNLYAKGKEHKERELARRDGSFMMIGGNESRNNLERSRSGSKAGAAGDGLDL
jgi:hypothetical protein